MCFICAQLYSSSPWERVSGQASETDESTKVSGLSFYYDKENGFVEPKLSVAYAVLKIDCLMQVISCRICT